MLMVASEVSPWAKTGGLADVTARCRKRSSALGHEVTIVLPRYRGVELPAARRDAVHAARSAIAATTSHFTRTHALVPTPGGAGRASRAVRSRRASTASHGRDYRRQLRALRRARRGGPRITVRRTTEGRPVDIIHAHDWQAGLVPTLLRVGSPRRYPASRRRRHRLHDSQPGVPRTVSSARSCPSSGCRGRRSRWRPGSSGASSVF